MDSEKLIDDFSKQFDACDFIKNHRYNCSANLIDNIIMDPQIRKLSRVKFPTDDDNLSDRLDAAKEFDRTHILREEDLYPERDNLINKISSRVKFPTDNDNLSDRVDAAKEFDRTHILRKIKDPRLERDNLINKILSLTKFPTDDDDDSEDDFYDRVNNAKEFDKNYMLEKIKESTPEINISAESQIDKSSWIISPTGNDISVNKVEKDCLSKIINNIDKVTPDRNDIQPESNLQREVVEQQVYVADNYPHDDIEKKLPQMDDNDQYKKYFHHGKNIPPGIQINTDNIPISCLFDRINNNFQKIILSLKNYLRRKTTPDENKFLIEIIKFYTNEIKLLMEYINSFKNNV